MGIDPRTIFIILTLILAVLGLALFVFYLARPRDHWLGYWSLGDFSAMGAVLLLSLRGSIPILLSISIANMLAVLSWGCCWNGCRLFMGHRPRLIPLSVLLVIVFSLLTIPSPISAHLYYRLLVLSTAMDILVVATGMVTLKIAMRERLYCAWFATLLAGAIAIIIGLRGCWGAMVLHSAMLMASNSMLGSLMLPSVIVTLVWNLCLILMAGERLRHVLLREANSDELTDVLNRRGFYAALNRKLRHEDGEHQVSLILIDLDYLKTINDSLGHAAGDRLLRCLARTVGSHLRADDAIGRLGGDEFAVALSGVGRRQVMEIADRLRNSYAVAAALIANEFRPTLSVGVAFYEPHEHSIEQFMARADKALYEAKAANHSGRDQLASMQEETRGSGMRLRYVSAGE